MRERVARSRELVAEGYPLAAVARVAKITRQALYRIPKPRSMPERRLPLDEVERAIVETAEQPDGRLPNGVGARAAASSTRRSTASACCASCAGTS